VPGGAGAVVDDDVGVVAVLGVSQKRDREAQRLHR